MLEPYIVELVGGILSLVTLTLVGIAARHLGIQVSADHRDAIQAAVRRAAGAAAFRYGPQLREAMTIGLDDPAVIEAADYVQRRLPDKLKKLKLSPEDVRDLVTTEIANRMGAEPIPPPVQMSEAEAMRRVAELLEQILQLRKAKS